MADIIKLDGNRALDFDRETVEHLHREMVERIDTLKEQLKSS